LDTEQLDTLATIGVYLQKLDEFTRACLALFFVMRFSDDAAAQYMSKVQRKAIMGQQILRCRKKALKRLTSDFRAIGLIGSGVL